MRIGGSSKQCCWMGPSGHSRCGIPEYLAVPNPLWGPGDSNRKFRWRNAARIAPGLGGDKRARPAAAVGDFKFGSAQPGCGFTT